jgi:hypothetical protein
MEENEATGLNVSMREGREAYKVMIGILEWEIPLKRPRHRWEDIIKVEPYQVLWFEDVSWIEVQ